MSNKEQPKNTDKTSNKDSNIKDDTKLFTRTPNEHFWKTNLPHLTTEQAEVLMGVEPKEVPIDRDITIQGCKNPLVCVFIGFSTQSLLDALKRKKKKTEFIVCIEPDPAIFKYLLMTEDVSDLLKHPCVEFLVGIPPQDLLTTLFKVFTKPVEGAYVSRAGFIMSMERVIDPFTYKGLDNEVAKSIDSIITSTIKHIGLSMGCSDDQGTRWKMMIDNRDIMYEAQSIKPMFNKFKDIPIVVAGGGPSLNDFIEAYHNSPELKKSLIIAADAVLHKLLTHDIKPHIVVRCERKLTQIFKGVKKEDTKGILYCGYPWTPGAFFDLFDSYSYLFRDNGVCLFTEFNSHAHVNGGVSSANACLELALLLSTSKNNIYLTGIDLCFVGGKSHIDGTQVEFNPENSKKDWTKQEANDGTMAETIPVWVRCWNEYKQSIDKHFMKEKGKIPKIYNTSTKGLKMDGVEYKPWGELLPEVPVSSKILDPRAFLAEGLVRPSQEEKDNFIKLSNQALQDCEDIKEACKISIDLAKDANATAEREVSKMFLRAENESDGSKFDFIRMIRMNQPNFDKLTKNIADMYDINFKSKYYGNLTYRKCILDVLQLDTYYYENAVNSLVNIHSTNDSRYLEYAKLTKDYLIKIQYYCDYFTEILSPVKCAKIKDEPIEQQESKEAT